METAEARRLVAQHPLWYHTMELAPGVVTPGLFDLRPIVDTLPWPDVRGKRCLDVGTYDGYLAFDMERRGATEVIAVDVGDQRLWDWPADVPVAQREGRSPMGAGFDVAARILDSRVERRPISIYDLDAATVGKFDVVVCGAVLEHLRDPVRGLEAMRSVCDGSLLSFEHVDVWLTALFRRRPVARLNGTGPWCDWWAVNAAAHERMLYAAGFEIERAERPFIVPFNKHDRSKLTPRGVPARLVERALTGSAQHGVITHAVLAGPRL